MKILASLITTAAMSTLLASCCSYGNGCGSCNAPCDCDDKVYECKVKCCSPQPHWWNRDCCDPSNYDL